MEKISFMMKLWRLVDMKMSLEGWAWRILIEACSRYFLLVPSQRSLLRIAAMPWLRLLAVFCSMERFSPMYFEIFVACSNDW
jgi:hypothetical protein